MIKKIALISALLGIFALFMLLNLSTPAKISSPKEMSALVDNSLVSTTGKVVSERILYKRTKLIVLDNKIELICSSCPSYANKTIQATGTTEKYENKTQISVLRITKT